jgi:propionyl-CoA carboxylase alpha chain
MFKKILVANRGEIACRVMRTARRLGIATVAVYSEADKHAPHVSLADEARHIGAPLSAQSYLSIDKLIQACIDTGAEAVHPGYGFLSENAEFAEALAKHRIVFIGPGVHAIRAMGDKIESKRLAAKAGVNTIPGVDGALASVQDAVAAAAEIGYPVMIKASAGGGGKGMRIAFDEAECREGFKRAASEAESSFGDGRLFVEKFITEPRHIEIQVLADSHGNRIYLGERECSVQRRHQKVIEEAPSPLLDDATRQAMGEQALALAEAVDYQSAGTVEFVADAAKNFYFLEMNTRLQVEHPVTEQVTGVDLVEQMIRIAAGETLQINQDDVAPKGWAVEARVYAEDPSRGFLPSTGRLYPYFEPQGLANLRVDSGVSEGSEISMFYDPMIAKVIGHADSRADAIRHLSNGLDAYCIRGVCHNISFLQDVLNHEAFRDGELTTAFIERNYPNGFQQASPGSLNYAQNRRRLIAIAAVVHCLYVQRDQLLGGDSVATRLSVQGDWCVIDGDESYHVQVERANKDWSVTVAGHTLNVITDWRFSEPQAWFSVDNQRICVDIEKHDLRYRLRHQGQILNTLVLSQRAAILYAHMLQHDDHESDGIVISPMPGLLVNLAVAAGSRVEAGDELAVIEAMKMENIVRADRDGVIAKVLVNAGDSVSADQVIFEFV